jgi:hypothetical protein
MVVPHLPCKFSLLTELGNYLYYPVGYLFVELTYLPFKSTQLKSGHRSPQLKLFTTSFEGSLLEVCAGGACMVVAVLAAQGLQLRTAFFHGFFVLGQNLSYLLF